MDYMEMVTKLQTLYRNKIMLISCGAFYIAVGVDAKLLNEKIDLKLNCMRRYLCKVGVPKTSIEKYVKILKELGYSYIVLDYDKEKNEIIKKYEAKGDKQKIETIYISHCSTCKNNKNKDKTEYEEAFNKYMEKEFGENAI